MAARAGIFRYIVDVFHVTDSGTDGYQDPTYTRQRPPGGQSWRTAKRTGRGREDQVGGQMQHTTTIPFVFRDHAASVLNGDAKLRHDGRWYSITNIAPDFGERTILVEAVHMDDEPDPEDVVE